MEKDLLKGDILPSFLLCKRLITAPTRSGYVVHRYGTKWTAPLCIVSDFKDKDYLISFLSNYRFSVRTTHTNTNKKKNPYRKVYPKGALFWFECTATGNPTGVALYVKNIPDKEYKTSIHDQGWHYIKEHLLDLKTKCLYYEDLLSYNICNDRYFIEEQKKELPQLERHAEAAHKKRAKQRKEAKKNEDA